MTTEYHDAAGPDTEYDGLPALLAGESGLPRIHPYAPIPVEPTRALYITPGGGRLQIIRPITRPIEKRAHILVTLDHWGRPAQLTDEKNAAYTRLALAVKAHCVQAGCRHHPEYEDNALRIFEVITEGITIAAFVRAALAIELGDFTPTDRLLQETEALAGHVRQAGEGDRANGG
ncbi:DUF6420 family protein [Streptomyces canus]|uniref:DUF6420 family protein n=1 Tax=Streptomyces canus TaxID=58343 RepID=UPI003254B0B3